MTAKEAKEIVETLEHGMSIKRIIELGLVGTAKDRRDYVIKAQGYLDGYNSKEALERPEVKALVKALEHADKRFVDMNFEEIGFNTLGRIRQALTRYRETIKQ